MRAILAVAACMIGLSACGSPPALGRESEAEALVAAFEKTVPLPDATRPLGGYHRYYSVSDERIEAVYLPARPGTARAHVAGPQGLPEPRGNGCAVVSIAYDRTSKSFERVLCNGLKSAEAAPAAPPLRPFLSRGERG